MLPEGPVALRLAHPENWMLLCAPASTPWADGSSARQREGSVRWSSHDWQVEWLPELVCFRCRPTSRMGPSRLSWPESPVNVSGCDGFAGMFSRLPQHCLQISSLLHLPRKVAQVAVSAPIQPPCPAGVYSATTPFGTAAGSCIGVLLSIIVPVVLCRDVSRHCVHPPVLMLVPPETVWTIATWSCAATFDPAQSLLHR
jgi:hypothetical protein